MEAEGVAGAKTKPQVLDKQKKHMHSQAGTKRYLIYITKV